MTGKPWWASKAVIGGVGTMAAGVVAIVNEATGLGLNPDEIKALVEQGAGWAIGGYLFFTGFLSIWGRIKASLPIRRQIVPGIKPKSPMVIEPQEGPLPWLEDNQPPQ